MLRLLLLRHAEAATAVGGSDAQRPLTPQGRAHARRLGAYLKQSGETPDLALVSPALRTLETMAAVEHGMAREIPSAVAPSLYNASMATLLALIEETPSAIRKLLVVGHNPSLGEAADALSLEGRSADLASLRAQFPAPCLAVIDLKGADWRRSVKHRGRLERFITLAALQQLENGA